MNLTFFSKHCISFLLIIGSCCLLGDHLTLSQFQVKRFKQPQSLQDLNGNDVAQSESGHLWIATDAGLVRFDGIETETFGSGWSELWHMPDGTIVVSLNHTLHRVSGLGLDNLPGSAGLEKVLIRSVTKDDHGQYWIGTQMKGLYTLVGGTVRHVEGLASGSVQALFIDDEGALWAGTNQGLYKKKADENSFQQVKIPDAIAVDHMAQTSDGTMWLGTRVGLFQEAQGSFHKVSDVTVLCMDVSDSALWIGTQGHGLGRHTSRYGLEWLDRKHDLLSPTVQGLCIDREQSRWVCNGRGLVQIRAKKIYPWLDKHGEAVVQPTSIIERRNGDVLVGNRSGRLVAIRQGSLTDFPVAGHSKGRPITGLLEDHQEKVWFGVARGGLWIIQDGDAQAHQVLENPNIERISAMVQDHNHRIWAGTRGDGLLIFESGGNQMEQPIATPLNDVQVTALAHRAETIYVGTLANGLWSVETNQTQQIAPQSKLRNAHIHAIHVDNDTVWIATNDSGLFRLNGTFISAIGLSHGLPGNQVFQILKDHHRQFWLTSESGITSVRIDDIERFFNSQQTHFEATLFGAESGLSAPCVIEANPAGLVRSDGILLIPTKNRLLVVDPARMVRSRISPPIHLNRITVDGQDTPGDTDRLPPMAGRIQFHYSALSLVNPERVRYRYKLEGVDRNWIEADRQRHAAYQYIPPRHNTLLISATNHDGIWSEQSTEFDFYVTPTLLQSYPFYIGLALFLVALGWSLNQFGPKAFAIIRFWYRSKYVGTYRLLGKIGQGGMGTVYKARSRDHQIVALKVLDRIVPGERRKARFLRESMICEKFQHPNIIKIYDKGDHDETCFYTMEFFDGVTLRDLIEQRDISAPVAVAVVAVLLDVLKTLHAKNVIHRDLKPENIMVHRDLDFRSIPIDHNTVALIRKNLRLLDFGLAKSASLGTLTKSGVMAGTICYLPPEYISGKDQPKKRIDFYSLGVVLYEMLTDEMPFAGADALSLIFAIMKRDPIAPETINLDVSPSLNAFTLAMLDKDPQSRLRHIDDIEKAFSQVYAHYFGITFDSGRTPQPEHQNKETPQRQQQSG